MRPLADIKRDAEAYQRAYRLTGGGAECQRTRDTLDLVAAAVRLRDALSMIDTAVDRAERKGYRIDPSDLADEMADARAALASLDGSAIHGVAP